LFALYTYYTVKNHVSNQHVIFYCVGDLKHGCRYFFHMSILPSVFWLKHYSADENLLYQNFGSFLNGIKWMKVAIILIIQQSFISSLSGNCSFGEKSKYLSKRKRRFRFRFPGHFLCFFVTKWKRVYLFRELHEIRWAWNTL
jgi:hypothetical protein